MASPDVVVRPISPWWMRLNPAYLAFAAVILVLFLARGVIDPLIGWPVAAGFGLLVAVPVALMIGYGLRDRRNSRLVLGAGTLALSDARERTTVVDRADIAAVRLFLLRSGGQIHGIAAVLGHDGTVLLTLPGDRWEVESLAPVWSALGLTLDVVDLPEYPFGLPPAVALRTFPGLRLTFSQEHPLLALATGAAGGLAILAVAVGVLTALV